MLCIALRLPNCKSQFLFVLQQFPQGTEDTGLLLLFVTSSCHLTRDIFTQGKCAFFWGCFCTVRCCQGTAGEERRYIFFAAVASSPLPRSFPFSPLLLQHHVVSDAAPLKVVITFVGLCGTVFLHAQRPSRCTLSEQKSLSLTSLMCVNEITPLQGGSRYW